MKKISNLLTVLVVLALCALVGRQVDAQTYNSNPATQGSQATLTGLAASASLGGGALTAGNCAATTVTIIGATVGMVVAVTPRTYPGDGDDWRAYISATNTVTVKVCAITSNTPTASIYDVRVVQ